MREFKTSDIEEVIVLVSNLYSEKKQPTKENNDTISNFFMNYMDKAITKCQEKSRRRWYVTRAKSDVAFNDFSVEVTRGPNEKIQFIVATMFGPHHSVEDRNEFQNNSIDSVLKKYTDPVNGEWVTVFNKLACGLTLDGKFNTGLFVSIRFNDGFFKPVKEASNEPIKTIH